MSSTTDFLCNHPIHNLSFHFPNIHMAECKKLIYYKRYTVRTRNAIRMCGACNKLRQFRKKSILVVCHWMTYGDVEFVKCDYCQAPLSITRPLLECRECIYTYFERAIYERSCGKDINNIGAFAYCRTHNQGVCV